MDSDRNGYVQISEFVYMYYSKQRELKDHISELEIEKKKQEVQRVTMADRLKQERMKERVNEYGLDQDAVLQVRVVEARNLMAMDINGKSDPYVVLSVGNETFKTKIIDSNLNPVWNEIHTFDVRTGREQLKIEVYDHDDLGSDDFLGKELIPSLQEFQD